MKKKIKGHRLTVFFALYAVFTIICGCLSWIFSEHRILMFQIWYQVSAVIRLALAVTAVMLLIRLLKLKKLRNKINHRKE
ncbi:conjugal transfer protein [Dysosmobacter welbionis]